MLGLAVFFSVFARMALASGSRIGPFEILGPAGAGGMGEVYRARDTRLDRTVAIKVLPADTQADPQWRQTLRREAEAVAALSHPHICALYDVGREAELDFLVMEFLEGETLRARLQRGPMPLGEALRVAREIAEALSAAHRAGIVHRDLKPSNVMLTRSGVKLLDFGLAARRPAADLDAASRSEAVTLTKLGMLVGTLPYMAPEQVEGRAVDARTDIFALGAVVYESIAGAPPFRGESPAAIAAAILGTPPPALSTVRSGIPESVDRLVAACLARDPDERWQSAADLVRELDWASRDLGRPATPAAASKRRTWLLHATWAVVATLFLIAWLQRGRGGPSPPSPNPRPVVVLMDSPLPGRVYDSRTETAGGTNADDLTDALRGLPVVVQKENTSALWHREDQVVRMNPDLVVCHLSCLLDIRPAAGRSELAKHLFDLAVERLVLFFGYITTSNPRTQFVVYSRTHFDDPERTKQWVEQSEGRFPALRGRLHPFDVPGSGEKTFRDPEVALLMRARVAEVLGLEERPEPSGSHLRK
jgi:serine/threonine protein kinase